MFRYGYFFGSALSFNQGYVKLLILSALWSLSLSEALHVAHTAAGAAQADPFVNVVPTELASFTLPRPVYSD